jgi:hypothetical protein
MNQYTPDEAHAYRRVWGGLPPGYDEYEDEMELVRRHGARHALCFPRIGSGDFLCRHATATDKGCGTLFREGR